MFIERNKHIYAKLHRSDMSRGSIGTFSLVLEMDVESSHAAPDGAY
jgi:hypothetical protein